MSELLMINIENLKIAVAYLKTLDDDRLYMLHFFAECLERIKLESEGGLHVCNSPACVVGHSVAVIPKLCSEDFLEYSERVFGIIRGSKEWEWCFGSGWPDDLSLAIERLEYVIEHGKAPDDFDSTDYEKYYD